MTRNQFKREYILSARSVNDPCVLVAQLYGLRPSVLKSLRPSFCNLHFRHPAAWVYRNIAYIICGRKIAKKRERLLCRIGQQNNVDEVFRLPAGENLIYISKSSVVTAPMAH